MSAYPNQEINFAPLLNPKAKLNLKKHGINRQFKNETHQPQELTKKGSSGTV